MNKWMVVVVGVGAVVLAACGRELGPVEVGTPVPAGERELELRITGEDAAAFRYFLLHPDLVSVSAGKVELQVTDVAERVDLAQAGHAPLLGRFKVPAGVTEVQVSVLFDEYGDYDRGEGAAWFQVARAPIRFTAPVKTLQQRGHAVIHLNLARSMVEGRAGRGEKMLMPSLDVRF